MEIKISIARLVILHQVLAPMKVTIKTECYIQSLTVLYVMVLDKYSLDLFFLYLYCYIVFFILQLVDHSDPQVGPYSPTFSFGNSTKNRTLSESNRLWASSDNSTPSPNAYNINKPSTQDYLKDLLGVSKWKLKKSKRKLRTTEKLTKFETRTLTDEISLLEKRIKAINRELSLTPPPVSPIKKHKNPFVMTELKPHQKDIKIDNAPTFYMNEETDWDFGARNRGLNVPDMNSFGYSKKFVEEKELEEQTQADVITGSSRYVRERLSSA